MGSLFSSPKQKKDSSAISASPKVDSSAISVKTPDGNTVIISNQACFGAGCYWGTEKYFKSVFPGFRSIVQGKVGFMGPADAPKNPTYEDVCTGATGHVEVYWLEFTNGAETYEELCRFFFTFHDPTTLNKQGNDRGTQYASVIFAYDQLQFEIAQKVIAELQNHLDTGAVSCYSGKKITTAVKMSTDFYPAHAAHQEYLEKNPKGYCNHRIRLKKWPNSN